MQGTTDMDVRRLPSEPASASSPHPTDAPLVAAAQCAPAAFAPLYARYRDDVLRYCFYRLGDWEEAADAAQQVFVNAFTALPRFVDQGDSFRPWLFRIAHNEVSTRRRRPPHRSLMDATLVIDTAPSPEDLAVAADDHDRLRRLLAALPSERRQVCELRLAGLTDREIAGVLGKREGAVRTAQSRAVAQLRGWLGVSRAPAGEAHG